MSKQSIGWQVKEGRGDDMIVLRSFEDVSCNLFDTLDENIKFYGEDYVLESLNGTSILVQIQNHMRTRSTAKKDDGSWKYSDKELIEYANTFKPQSGTRSSMYNDASDEVLKARAIVKAFEKEQKAKKADVPGTLVKDRK